MDKILYFDYCAVAILGILTISTYFRKMIHGRVNRYYFSLLIVSLLSVLFDIAAVRLDAMGMGHRGLKMFTHTMYLLLHNYSTPLYLTYLVALTDTWHRVQKSKLIPIAISAPFVIAVLALIQNLFTHNIFYLDGTDAYTRGPLFSILYASAIVYGVTSVGYVIYYHKIFPTSRFISLATVFPFMLASTLIQYLKPHILMEMFASAISLMFISMMIQRPEELIEPDTGLKRLSAYIEDVNRMVYTQKPANIIMLNITNYTSLRAMLGYATTNAILQAIASELFKLNAKYILNSDMYYLGEGKFRIVNARLYEERTIQAAEAIHKALSHNMHLVHSDFNVTPCVCITRFPEDISSSEALLSFGTDLNKFPPSGSIVYAADLFKQNHYDIMHDIDRIIDNALAKKSFEVYYQPIYSVTEQRFNSAEALLRLKDETYGFISPDIFISAAEKNGSIHQIGRFVLDEVCAFIASEDYTQLGLDYIEVNLSVVQCMRKDLPNEVFAVLDKYKVQPSQLNLEITETAASYSEKILTDNLNILSEQGICFSLDDYGTGYSNMKRISTLPFRLIKLDKTFTEVDNIPKMRIILENTIRMIKAMNLKIVVEGVETKNMLDTFAEMDCEYIQGYYFSKPIPKDDFVKFIQKELQS